MGWLVVLLFKSDFDFHPFLVLSSEVHYKRQQQQSSLLFYRNILSRARSTRVKAVKKHYHCLWPIVSSLCSTYGHSTRGPAIWADATCGTQCCSSEIAILYSSYEKEFKLINYLISNRYGGGGGEEALAKNILLQNKLHHSQSCDNNQMTNQNNSLNLYIQL